MATKIRLQRHGKKKYPFYHIVAVDSHAKRDGRFIEKLGTYNPNTNPAVIDINFDSCLKWVRTGAQMTDTARAILSYKGVLLKNHLLRGVEKGALSEADVDKKFEQWQKEKESKIAGKSDAHAKAIQEEQAKRLKEEQEKNEARAKELAVKNMPEEPESETATEETADVAPATEKTEEQPAEEPKAEEKSEEEPQKEEQPAEKEEDKKEG